MSEDLLEEVPSTLTPDWSEAPVDGDTLTTEGKTCSAGKVLLAEEEVVDEDSDEVALSEEPVVVPAPMEYGCEVAVDAVKGPVDLPAVIGPCAAEVGSSTCITLESSSIGANVADLSSAFSSLLAIITFTCSMIGF